MGILPRKLFQSFNFRSHSAGEHQRDHFVITHERPERILERRRLVFLDEEMRQPRAAVTGNEAQKEQPPLPDRDQVDQQSDACGRADQVKDARRRAAVFCDVKRPELSK